MLLPCYYHHVLRLHFDLFLTTKSLFSRGKRASRVGGSRSRWQAGRTSINLHQLKVEEDRHALYQISANYTSSSSRSLQTTTTVVLTIINNIHDHSHNQCSVQRYHNSAATATQHGPREALRSAQLAAGQHCGVLGAHRSPQIPLQPMGGCQHLYVHVAIDPAML